MPEQTITPKALSGTAKRSNVPYGTLQTLTEEKISYQQRLLKGFCNLVWREKNQPNANTCSVLAKWSEAKRRLKITRCLVSVT